MLISGLKGLSQFISHWNKQCAACFAESNALQLYSKRQGVVRKTSFIIIIKLFQITGVIHYSTINCDWSKITFILFSTLILLIIGR